VNLRGAPPDQLEFLERIGVTSAGTSNGAAEPAAIVNDDASPLHERVKAARLARGWSQRELAEAAGTHQPIVSKLENGRPVDDALLARILAVLGERPFLNL
jgi:ribosome-binding protein aMBF1 (putative translation factor)